jgi:hypothetical protein
MSNMSNMYEKHMNALMIDEQQNEQKERDEFPAQISIASFLMLVSILLSISL